MKEKQRQEIAELIHMLERNINRLDSKQYNELKEGAFRKIRELENEGKKVNEHSLLNISSHTK